MNPLNYASLEASKRLVAAGIVLETEAVRERHRWPGGERWILVSRGIALNKTIPAPSMAEVWRELPVYCGVVKGVDESIAKIAFDPEPVPGPTLKELASIQRNTNPTDALIDLLIFTKGL